MIFFDIVISITLFFVMFVIFGEVGIILFSFGLKWIFSVSFVVFCISILFLGFSLVSCRFSRLKFSGCIFGSLKNRLSTVYVSSEKCIFSRIL